MSSLPRILLIDLDDTIVRYGAGGEGLWAEVAERFPDAPRFVERKRENRFNTPEFVAQHILALAFDPAAKPAEVCVRLPDESAG